MACAYAHMTITELLNRNKLIKVKIPDEIINIISNNIKYCNFGSVCPDLSYLAQEPHYSDLMHFIKTGDFVKHALNIIKTKKDKDKEKCIAWLFGYVSHMVTDMVIHPIIEEKVGEYSARPENALNHLKCEMYQDTYIFKEKLELDISKSEFIDARLKECGNGSMLDEEITNFWNEIFEKNYPEENSNKPNINDWFLCFTNMIDISEDGELISNKSDKKVIAIGLAHTIINQFCRIKGFIYPKSSEIDPNNHFLTNLPTPNGPDSYLNIFDKALTEVINSWEILSDAILNINDDYINYFSNWNLGSGTFSSSTKYVFWEGHLKKLSDPIINPDPPKNKNSFVKITFSKFPSWFNDHPFFSLLIAIIVFIILTSSTDRHFKTNDSNVSTQEITVSQTFIPDEKILPRILSASRYIETALNKKLIPEKASPKEILKIACLQANDINTFNALSNYDIDISFNSTTAVLLIGNKTKNEKYYEDHAWTAILDERFTTEINIKGFYFIHSLTK